MKFRDLPKIIKDRFAAAMLSAENKGLYTNVLSENAEEFERELETIVADAWAEGAKNYVGGCT